MRLSAAACLVAVFCLFPSVAGAPPIGGRPVDIHGPGLHPVEPFPRIRDSIGVGGRRRLVEREQVAHQAARAWDPFPTRDHDYSIFDATTDPVSREALRGILAADSVAQRLSIDQWPFVSRPKMSEIGRMLELARKELPGELVLGRFFDEAYFGEAGLEITAAWAGRPITQMPHAEYIDYYMSDLRGKTLIAIGHVDGDSFLMRNNAGATMSLSLRLLSEKAVQHGVIVVPIGCKSSFAGAPIGFIQNIGTRSVAEFLGAILKPRPTVADLISGLMKVGEIRVNLSDAIGQFSVQVNDPALPQAQITHVSIPYSAPVSGFNSAPGSSVDRGAVFVENVEAAADSLRPFYAKNSVRAVLGSPFTYVSIWVALAFGGWHLKGRLLSNVYGRPRPKLLKSITFFLEVSKFCFWAFVFVGGFTLVLLFPPLFFLIALGAWVLQSETETAGILIDRPNLDPKERDS